MDPAFPTVDRTDGSSLLDSSPRLSSLIDEIDAGDMGNPHMRRYYAVGGLPPNPLSSSVLCVLQLGQLPEHRESRGITHRLRNLRDGNLAGLAAYSTESVSLLG